MGQTANCTSLLRMHQTPTASSYSPWAETAHSANARFTTRERPSPFYIAFLHNRPDTFIVAYAVGDGVGMGRIDADGKIKVGPLVPIDTSAGKPSELCWLAISAG